MGIKVIFFDLYGVYVKYLDNDVGLENIRKILSDDSVRERVFDFERGKVSAMSLREHCLITHPTLRDVEDWEQNGVFSEIVGGTDPNILAAIHALKGAGFKVGLLCNNGYWTDRFERSMIPEDLSLFDVVVESCRIGIRKSDPEIYHIAAARVGAELEECVLVDDSLLNIQGAIREGMHGIHQKGEDSLSAIAELEALLGVSLRTV